jgi:hypothetical protein
MERSGANAASSAFRVSAAAFAVAVLALWASSNSYLVSRNLSEQRPDMYGARKAHLRFAPALPLLPPAGRVTYISDLKFDDGSGTAAFLTAQNALAPRLLVMPGAQAQTEYAIGQFSQQLDYAEFGSRHGFAFQRDLGNGVALYRRK